VTPVGEVSFPSGPMGERRVGGRRVDWMYPLHATQAALRHRRLFSVLLALYLALDFADPCVPGLLNFTIDFNRDAIPAKATAELEEPTLALLALAHRKVMQVEFPQPHRSPAPPVARFLGDWLPTLRLPHERSPGSSDPDH